SQIFYSTNNRKKMTIKTKNILGIDRGSKYIGLAYSPFDQSISFPIGYLMNDQMIYFNMGDIVQRHNIKKIVIGRPKKQINIQEKIKDFIKNLEYIIDTKKIEIDTVEEDYTSVQSGEIVSNFKKNVAEDTVSAMLILERRKKEQK
ncbi:MAG TPA: Holliday junction resolvase RuvX, partial [Candidatus Absconditabacterales bacterium]|nr:Holliday junction resolvase RuvX [Candidatus Absconditabacterales bacterium]